MTARERFDDALRNAGKYVNGKTARCPAHDDNNPSLSISDRPDGKGILVHCHAGCDYRDVLSALGWSPRDLFDDEATSRIYDPKRDYTYPDRTVHRRPGKGFHQSGNTKGKSLFHADRIGDAETVYWPEGEKDVEAIEAAGGVAVCSAMGAGKAHLADVSRLRGKHVIVIADKDEPGRKHARQIRKILTDVADSVHIVEAAVGKDFADHFAAGKGLDDLVSIADSPDPDDGPPQCRLWPATKLQGARQPRWLAKGRIPRGSITLLIGDEGIGKSLFWVYIVAAITTGRALPEFGIPERDPGRVAIAITEDNWSEVVLPRLQVAGADIGMIDVFCEDTDGSGSPTFPAHIHLVEEAETGYALIVVDAWLDTVPSGLSVRDGQQARVALHPWKEVATKTDAAAFLVCHTNRVSSANARDKYGATIELRKKARMTLFAQTDEDSGHLNIGPEKANSAAILPASQFTITPVKHFPPTDDDDGTVPKLTYVGDSARTARQHIADSYQAAHEVRGDSDDAVAWLAARLAPGPQWSKPVHDAAEMAGIGEHKFRSAKKRLHVESIKDGVTERWFMALPEHQGRTPALQGVEDAPVSTGSTCSTPSTSSSASINQHVASTSEDVKMLNRERQPQVDGYGKTPFCPGCGYFFLTKGFHRADCAAAKPTAQQTPNSEDAA